MGLLSWLFNASSDEQVVVIEREEPTFEERLKRIVAASQGLSGRSEAERLALIEDVTEALDIIEGAIQILGATELALRAKATRTKLKSVKTRAQKAA